MLEYLLIGAGFALSAGLQPGPLQAFFLARVARDGWQRTLPAAFSPLISDGPIALVALLLLQTLPESFRDLLQVAGGVLLVYFAWSSFRSAGVKNQRNRDDSKRQPTTILQAALVNLLNPNPYLGWSLVMGPAVLNAWEDGPGMALILVLTFYITMISTSILLIVLMGTTSFLKPAGQRILLLISASLLAGLGFYYLGSGGWRLIKTV